MAPPGVLPPHQSPLCLPLRGPSSLPRRSPARRFPASHSSPCHVLAPSEARRFVSCRSWFNFPLACRLAHLGMGIASTWEVEARQHRAEGAAKPVAFSALLPRRRVAESDAVGAQLDARWKARSGEPSLRDANRPWHRKHTAIDGAARSHCSAAERHSRLCPRPVPAPDWKSVLLRSRLNCNMEEIQPPENVTWEQVLPGLPPNGRASQRACFCLKTSGLQSRPKQKCGSGLSRNFWRYVQGVPRWACSPEVLQAHGHGLMEVQKKDSVLPNGRPILRMIINAKPLNTYQELLSGDITKLPFAQWNGIHLDRDVLVVSWSEADMSAFWIFRVEPSWFPWQALAKPVPASFAAQWCPELAFESLVCPAVTAVMMEWKSVCGVLQHAHCRLCFAQPPAGAGLTADSEIRRASWVRL